MYLSSCCHKLAFCRRGNTKVIWCHTMQTRTSFCQNESLVGWASALRGWSCDAAGPSDAHLRTTAMLLMIIMVMLNFLLVKCSVGQFLPNSREAYEAKEAEQMDELHFDGFTLSFTKLIMSVNLSAASTASFSYISSAHLFIFLYVCCGQTQAEAHYKGHKHARKLKALETQRNRQKRGHSPSKLVKDKDQDMKMLGGATASSPSHLKDITGKKIF